jgi:arabinofuranosyltransferase
MYYFKGNGLFGGLPWVDLPGYAWRYIGEYWKRSGIRVKAWDSAGMVGYFAGPQVHIVDRLAITEPLLARLPMKVIPKWRIGHYPREVPLGYLETLESGHNQIADRHLGEYYDKLALIIRGPLWDPARWQAIWMMNTGQYDNLKN